MKTRIRPAKLGFVLILFYATLTARASETNLSALPRDSAYADLGELILTQFVSAPFPHPNRASGHKYKEKFFSAQEHYQDSTVAIFVPKNFRPQSKIDFVVHFHGWGNNVTNALRKYQLIQQFTASGKNAILVVPQGPRDASDSFGGKLEDIDGFKRFMDEAMTTLQEKSAFKKSTTGKIILSGHSGGYEVISSILAVGGITSKIKEVWLFDALYAQTEKFQNWFAHDGVRFIDVYTANGGTKAETENLINDLKVQETDFFAGEESNVSLKELSGNRLVFLFSKLPHDEVMQKHKTFLKFLQTSCLSDIAKEK
jgi:hypothetical protein